LTSTKGNGSVQRICRISRRTLPLLGGLERHVSNLTVQQVAEGKTVALYTLSGRPEFESNNVSVHRLPGGVAINLLKRDSLIRLLFLLMFVPVVVVSHLRRSFDVFHLHGDFVEALAGIILTAITGRPAVVTVHAGLNRGRLYNWIAGHAFRRVSGLLAHSYEIRDELASLGVSVERITLSHSGIWVDQVANPNGHLATDRHRGESTDSSFTVVCVGRLHEMKGQKHLIEAMRLLPSESHVRTVMAGDGPDRDELRRLAAASHKDIEFAGEVAHEALVQLLHSADLFVLPSVSLARQRESTPTALLEAMAAGLPVVTTPSGGIKDIINEGVNGIIVPERDAVALAEAIRKLAADPRLRAEMGARNRKQAAHYDWSEVAEGVTRAYVSAGAAE
jgi:glycosyltransferase involved in cell wall biosynthesis